MFFFKGIYNCMIFYMELMEVVGWKSFPKFPGFVDDLLALSHWFIMLIQINPPITGESMWVDVPPDSTRQLGILSRPRNIPPSPVGEWNMKWMPWKICCYNIPVDWWHASAIPLMSSRLAVNFGVMSWRSWSRAASREIAGADWWSGPTVVIPPRPVCRS